MARCSWFDVRRTGGTLAGVAAVLTLAWVAARAQPAPSDTAEPVSVTLPPVDIVAPSPLLGSGVDRDTVPAETNVLKGDDLTRGGTLITPGVTRALNEQVGGVNLNSWARDGRRPHVRQRGASRTKARLCQRLTQTMMAQ